MSHSLCFKKQYKYNDLWEETTNDHRTLKAFCQALVQFIEGSVHWRVKKALTTQEPSA